MQYAFSSIGSSTQGRFSSGAVVSDDADSFEITNIRHHAHLNGVWRILPIRDQKLASASYDHLARIFPTAINQIEQDTRALILEGHKREVLCLAHDGTNLITGSSDGQIYFWNCNSGKSVKAIREPKNSSTGFYSMALLGGGRIATGACQKPSKFPSNSSWKHTIKIWDIDSKKVAARLEGHTGGISGLVAVGERLVSASADKTLRVWNLEKKTFIGVENAHKDYIYSVASIDPDHIVTGARDRVIKIWDINTLQTAETFTLNNSDSAHESTVYDVASFQENLVLSGSRDGYVRVWDRRSGDCVKALDAEGNFVYSVAGLPSGQIAAGTGTLRKEQNKATGEVIVWEFRG